MRGGIEVEYTHPNGEKREQERQELKREECKWKEESIRTTDKQKINMLQNMFSLRNFRVFMYNI